MVKSPTGQGQGQQQGQQGQGQKQAAAQPSAASAGSGPPSCGGSSTARASAASTARGLAAGMSQDEQLILRLQQMLGTRHTDLPTMLREPATTNHPVFCYVMRHKSRIVSCFILEELVVSFIDWILLFMRSSDDEM